MTIFGGLKWWLFRCILFCCIPVIEGCISTREVSTAELDTDPHQNITVELNDGRKISYTSGEYSTAGDSLRFIRGQGTLQPSGKLFSDSLSFDQIRRVTTHRYTPFFYGLFVLGGSGIALFLIALISGGLSPGG